MASLSSPSLPSPGSPPLKSGSRGHIFSSLPFSLSLSTLLSLFATVSIALFALFTTTTIFYTSHTSSSFPTRPPPYLPSTFIKPVDISSLSSSSSPSNDEIQSPLLRFPSRSEPHYCVNVVPVDAPHGDAEPFNSRSFCAHSQPVCITGRTTERHVGILHLSPPDLPSAGKTPCRVSTPALRDDISNNVSAEFPVSCDGLACAVRCAHGAHDALTDRFPTCADVVTLTDKDEEEVTNGNRSLSLKKEWLPSDDEILVVVPAYPFQANIFHFSQTVVPLFHSISTLLSSSRTSTTTKPNITLLFRGDTPYAHGAWQSTVFDSLLSHSGLKPRIRALDTLHEDDISLVRAGLLPPAVLTSRDPPLGRTICARGGAVLLGHRTHVNMWPFPGGNHSMFWPFNANPANPRVVPLTVPATALHVRAAVYSNVELPRGKMLDHVLRKAKLKRFVAGYRAKMRRRGKTLPDTSSNRVGGKWGKGMTWSMWFAMLSHPSYKHALDELHAIKRLENDPDFDRLMRDHSKSTDDSSQSHGLPLTRHFFHAPLTRRPRSALLDLPGRVLLYARRDPASTRRSFCCGSSSWVDAMVSRVAARHGFTVRTIVGGGGLSFSAQLAQLSDVGVIMGLHGANLVNSMFAPPLAALVEVSNMHMQCYVGGMNAGLAYWSVKPDRTATRTQSGCDRPWTEKELSELREVRRQSSSKEGGRIEGVLENPELCMYNPTWRAVILGREDRFRLEKSVTQAVQYVVALHAAFAKSVGAVPVVYKSDGSDEYEIDWRQGAR